MDQDVATQQVGGAEHDGGEAEIVEELLIEEISIDGMCGVY